MKIAQPERSRVQFFCALTLFPKGYILNSDRDNTKTRFHFYTRWHRLPIDGDNATNVSEFQFNVDRDTICILSP